MSLAAPPVSGLLMGLSTVSHWMGQACIAAGALRAVNSGQGAEEACDCGTPLSSGRDLLAMVSCPKSIRTHCKKCKIHQEHKVSQYKKGADSLVAQGKRRYDRKMQGFGGQKKPIFHKKAKVTKKVVLKLTCSECRSTWQRCIGRCKAFILG
eukprot:CAMPEP_0172177912 /NCGR_PEP_ID=MMETSP1050-20130122/15725_1 /TAXON_ID=233186 /ORGANISM="Cryptomonas curvata, Strain CCAP979/52" /LENGTH=151 /DNA_ID=CAMNT_0012850535 /DNA_START=361 /DNA_END=813 /DNA_ORIENTATION=-